MTNHLAGTPSIDPAINSDGYALVGELILTASMIDYQLNKILIKAMHLHETELLEPVVASLDIQRKIEMLKKRADLFQNEKWKNKLKNLCEKAEYVQNRRNVACHSVPFLKDGTWYLVHVTAAKILKKIKSNGENPQMLMINDLKYAIETGREVFSLIQDALQNLTVLNEKMNSPASQD